MAVRPATVRAVVVDVSDRDRAERFWCTILGSPVTARFGEYSYLGEIAPGVRLVLQVTDDSKTGKSRMHLDLSALDPGALLATVVELGGAVVGEVDDPAYALTVAADPDGNEFCVSRVLSDGLRDP